jgi:mannosyl-glycoprotein endo-beta-N-acetylglucosaminidase
MPKTYRRRSRQALWLKRILRPRPLARSIRSTRSTRSRKRRFPLSYTNVGIILIILGVIVAWWLTTHPRFLSPQTATYSVLGQPTVSADFINRVLDYYHSPAAGKGQALYDDGVKYGIDPVYALAFFMHESSFGTTGVATVTHSLGNIRASEGYQQYEGYRLYPTWEAGFEDWYKLIADQYVAQWKLVTVDQIVPVYAPSTENDVAAYIRVVKQAVDTWRDGSVAV